MNVQLVTDGRVFEDDGTDWPGTYEAGDVAWFEEDILLVTEIVDGVAHAVVHPAIRGKGAAAGIGAALRIHARTMGRGYLAALAFAQKADLESVAALTGCEVECKRLDGVAKEVERAQDVVR